MILQVIFPLDTLAQQLLIEILLDIVNITGGRRRARVDGYSLILESILFEESVGSPSDLPVVESAYFEWFCFCLQTLTI